MLKCHEPLELKRIALVLETIRKTANGRLLLVATGRDRPIPDVHQGTILRFGGAYRAGDNSYRYGDYQTEAEVLEPAYHQARRLMIKRLRMGYQYSNHRPQLRMA